MSNEAWLPIPKFAGYEISDMGRVRSLDRQVTQGRGYTFYTRTMRGRIIKQSNRGEYLGVTLSIGGVLKSLDVHRLVAAAFIGECPSPEHHAAHNDGNPHHNALSNLRWATPTDNANDKNEHGTMLRGERHPSSKISDADAEKVRQMRRDGVSARDAGSAVGISKMQAWRIGAGERRQFA